MRDLVQLAVDAARSAGASYADARLVYNKDRDLQVRNGELKNCLQNENLGIGIRVIVNGSWGFDSTSDISKDAISKIATNAVKIAKASSSVKVRDMRLADEPAHVAEWISPCKINPFEISIEEKINYMMKVDQAIRSVKGITFSNVDLVFRLEDKYYASSQGALIRQIRIRSGGGLIAGIFKDGEFQYRSWPTSFRGQWALKGYEILDDLKMPENAVATANEAIELIKAPKAPSGEMDIILESSQLALQIHESIGHPTELDRVLGTEANYAGMSFATIDKLGKFKYGSSCMNIVADARLEHGPSLGCFGYDDEGVQAQRVELIKEGIFTGYLSSRETATELNLARSGGCMRAMGWSRIPLIRMTQISILPGTWDFDSLIADTKDGIYMSINKSWSIDDRRLNFQFGCEAGYLIKSGKITGIVKNPSYAGITPQFWGSMDAVCGQKDWQLWGIPTCGKGQPPQTMEVSHGAAPARFRKVKVGVV